MTAERARAAAVVPLGGDPVVVPLGVEPWRGGGPAEPLLSVGRHRADGGVEVTSVTMTAERPRAAEVVPLGDDPVVVRLGMDSWRDRFRYERFGKPVFDFVMALVALVVLAPLL